MLTLQKLKDMKPRLIFAHKAGRMDGKTFMWVAVRGGIHDWAIYTTLNSVPMVDFWVAEKEGIAKHGNKLTDKDKIRELVPCTAEAFTRYRY